MYQLDQVAIRLVKDYPFYSDFPINTPERAVELMQEKMADLDREYLYLINLTTKCRPINANLISIGTLSQSLYHVREIFKSSILSNASMVMLVHNHPSGDCTPSMEDKYTTERILECSELLGIQLIDHIIIGGAGKYYSFRDQGVLEPHNQTDETDYWKIDRERLKIAEEHLEAMKEEALRRIQGTKDLSVKKAWYYSHLGSLDFAREIGVISTERQQELYKEFDRAVEAEKSDKN